MVLRWAGGASLAAAQQGHAAVDICPPTRRAYALRLLGTITNSQEFQAAPQGVSASPEEGAGATRVALKALSPAGEHGRVCQAS